MSPELEALLADDDDQGESEGGGAQTAARPIEDGPMSVQPPAAADAAAPAQEEPSWISGIKSLFVGSHDPDPYTYSAMTGGQTNDPTGVTTALVSVAIKESIRHL